MNFNQSPFLIESEVFTALAHPSRLEILELLRDGEACVCHIQAMLNHRQAYISQQLNVLRQTGVVNSRKDGLRVYYQISDHRLFEVIDQVKEIFRPRVISQPTTLPETSLLLSKKACNCPQCVSHAEDQAALTREM